MKTAPLLALALAGSAGFAAAEERRSEAAHVHGISRLDIAVESGGLTMALTAPAADIVGFEHQARSESEKKKLKKAQQTLLKPLTLFTPNAEAGCAVTDAKLVDAAHDEHDHHGHGHKHDDHGHNEHSHGDHGHEKHGHDDHGHGKHGHGKHGHDAHAEHGEEEHSDLGASYVLNCAKPGALSSFAFPYFTAFPNAQKIELRLITTKGQFGYTVARDAPTLDLSGAI